MTSGSDGSVFFQQQVAAAAWLISANQNEYMTACFLLQDSNAVSSYRSELEGVFRVMKQIEYTGMDIEEMIHWCDNELSVKNTGTVPQTPGDMIKADTDLVLAIHHMRTKCNYIFECKHVYGHQDEGKEKKKKQKKEPKPPDTIGDETIDELPLTLIAKYGLKRPPPPKEEEKRKEELEPRELPQEAKINIVCDEISKASAKGIVDGNTIPPAPLLAQPYEGSKAVFKIGRRWINSKYKEEIYKASRTPPVRAYYKEKFKKYKWDDTIFDSVHWTSVGAVRRKYGQTKRMHTSKTMSGWLPTTHMRHHITNVNQCPGCRHEDETVDHMFTCQNRHMVAEREKAIEAMEKEGKKKKIPKDVLKAFCHYIKTTCSGGTGYVKEMYPLKVKEAIQQQLKIGPPLMMRGFLVKGWHEAIKECGCSHPERQMNSLQQMIWDIWVERIWNKRNEIMYQKENKFNAAEDRQLNAKIQWYVRNKNDLLAFQDRFLAEVDVTRLSRMRPKTKKRWIKLLDRAKKIYDKDKTQKGRAQHTMWQFLGLADPASDAIT